MGFRLDRPYRLTFEGSALAGAEILIANTSVGTLLRLGELNSNDHVRKLAELLAEHVIEWNLEDRYGNPLKVDGGAILAAMENAVLDRIVTEWYRAARGISAPLDPPSDDGEPLEEGSIPMEPLSARPMTS